MPGYVSKKDSRQRLLGGLCQKQTGIFEAAGEKCGRGKQCVKIKQVIWGSFIIEMLIILWGGGGMCQKKTGKNIFPQTSKKYLFDALPPVQNGRHFYNEIASLRGAVSQWF